MALPLLDIIGPVVNKILAFIPDPKAKAEALAKAQEAALEHEEKIMSAFLASDAAQAAVNAEEAKSTNIFVSGWRPFLGWTFGGSFAWCYVLQPVLTFFFTAIGHPLALPTLDMSQMMPLVTGMLGLAGLRTYEKKTESEGNR